MGRHVKESRLVQMMAEHKFLVEVGLRLREARHSAGLTLGMVEAKSKGQFKGSAVGSYERAEREIPITKLMTLSQFYGVAMSELLPFEHLTSSHEANLSGEGNLSR